ncbi:MAG: TIGR00300 family protein [Actinobacteria bacterium]|nr:TIGR00300 family protein [Actinomycetota bacterium]
MTDKPYEDVRIEGHLIDSLMLPQVWDDIMDLEGEFEVLSFDVGRTKTETSTAVLRVFGRDAAHLDTILRAITEHGVVAVAGSDVTLEPAPQDGVFPERFYATTNMETHVRLGGEWVTVQNPEMDCGVRVDEAASRAETVAMNDVRAGELYVVGHSGVRVLPLERTRESQPFEFMASAVSSEKPKALIIREVARLLRHAREARKEIIAVVGPAVVHTGAGPHLARLIEAGYVTVLFGGNAVATHDCEAALLGTSLGISLREGAPVAGGHEHHLRAINAIRRAGSFEAAVEQGVLTEGIMHTLVTTGTPYVLAGSLRDDGPMPGVIPDMLAAQAAMRPYCRRAGACLMLSSMLHSIATGNLLPAAVRTICVDINPAVVTKLADRGSFQAIGIVTDVGLFLEQLANELGCLLDYRTDDEILGYNERGTFD